MKGVIPLVVMALLLAGGMAAYYFSEGQSRSREMRAGLRKISDVVATKDRAKIGAALNEFLTDDAQIHLSVQFFAIGNQPPVMDQQFDKAQFITFIDNLLYSSTDYGNNTQLATLDVKSSEITFVSNDWADGANMLGGTSIDMRYTLSSECTGTAYFALKAQLQKADCKVSFHQIPKPGQEGKILQKGNLMELLGK